MTTNRTTKFLLAASLIAAIGCGARAPASTPEPEPPRGFYGHLWRLLSGPQRAPEQVSGLDSLSLALGRTLHTYLANVSRDTTAPAIVRGNALIQLGTLGAAQQLDAFRFAFHSPDPRVRVGAVAGLRGLLPLRRDEVLGILERALRDTDRWVQAKALETIGTADVALLRDYLAATPEPQLRTIAEDLVRAAEQRGAPLAQGADGLSRRTPAGNRLVFRPLREWPQWQASVGELVVEPAGGDPVVLARDVEAVAGVVPAFFSSDERYLVYEAARQIRVRDLTSGTERVVGPGIAPRVLPFTPEFVFLRQIEQRPARDRTTITYEVLRTPFAAGEPHGVGHLEAEAAMPEHGAYSAARWMQVEEREGRFYLGGPGVNSFELPDPFQQHANTP